MKPLVRTILWFVIAAIFVASALAVRFSHPQGPTKPHITQTELPRRSASSSQLPPTAPDFTLKVFGGGHLSLSDFRGNVVVLNFWASWCTPCKEEMPILEQAWQIFRTKQVVVMGVDVEDDPETAAAFLKALRITYTNVYDPTQERITAYQITALPTTIFIDRGRRIRSHFVGGYQGPEGYRRIHEQIFTLLSSP